MSSRDNFFEEQTTKAFNVLIKHEHLMEFIQKFSNNSTGFIWAEGKEINEISKLLEFQGHSGASFALTLRQIQSRLNN